LKSKKKKKKRDNYAHHYRHNRGGCLLCAWLGRGSRTRTRLSFRSG
jgi:hypothetical protein